MRIFGKFEYSYNGLDLYSISLTPFDLDCYYVDLDGKETAETYIEGDVEDSSWKPYNAEISDYCVYSPTLNSYMSECEANEKLDDKLEFVEAEKITVYKEGKLIEEYFIHD